MNKDIILQPDCDGNTFGDVCEQGNMSLVKYMMNIIGTYNLSYGIRGACRGGHMDIIELMISKGAFILDLEYMACQGGHIDVINFLISKRTHGWNWNWGLYGACYGGHMDIVLFMISKGANGWNGGLYESCDGGHMDIALLMISKGADNWNEAFERACFKGHVDIVKLMISKGATSLYYGLFSAHEGGHTNIIELPAFNGITVDYKFERIYKSKIGRGLDQKMTILYWTITYSRYNKKKMIQKDLIPDLLKLIYFCHLID